jgi:hypothetical protein
MGVFNNEDVVFGRIKAGENLNDHVYHEPMFQNVPQKELHPIFKYLAIGAGLLFLVSLCGLDYRGVMLLGKQRKILVFFVDLTYFILNFFTYF